jgi:hypothetical protein
MLAKLFMKYLLIWLTSMLWLPLVRAQGTKPLSLAELAVYRGADREELLVTGAKKKVSSSGTPRLPADHTRNLPANLKQSMASKSRFTAAPAKI